MRADQRHHRHRGGSQEPDAAAGGERGDGRSRLEFLHGPGRTRPLGGGRQPAASLGRHGAGRHPGRVCPGAARPTHRAAEPSAAHPERDAGEGPTGKRRSGGGPGPAPGGAAEHRGAGGAAEDGRGAGAGGGGGRKSIGALAELLKTAERPVFIAGRGGRGTAARAALLALADDVGALLAEGAVAKGLFAGQPWAIDVAGGFSSPLTAELIAGADVVVGWGSALNMWTTGHGRLLGKDVRLVQVDLDVEAIGRNRPVALGIVGDVAATAQATSERLRTQGHRRRGYRTPPQQQQQQRIDAAILWRDTPYDDTGTTAKIDPRTLSIVLDDLIPTDRVVGVDSGNFMGYPSMYLRVPDENSFAFTQAFQSIGLGLATGIGTALAQPGRFPVLVG